MRRYMFTGVQRSLKHFLAPKGTSPYSATAGSQPQRQSVQEPGTSSGVNVGDKELAGGSSVAPQRHTLVHRNSVAGASSAEVAAFAGGAQQHSGYGTYTAKAAAHRDSISQPRSLSDRVTSSLEEPTPGLQQQQRDGGLPNPLRVTDDKATGLFLDPAALPLRSAGNPRAIAAASSYPSAPRSAKSTFHQPGSDSGAKARGDKAGASRHAAQKTSKASIRQQTSLLSFMQVAKAPAQAPGSGSGSRSQDNSGRKDKGLRKPHASSSTGNDVQAEGAMPNNYSTHDGNATGFCGRSAAANGNHSIGFHHPFNNNFSTCNSIELFDAAAEIPSTARNDVNVAGPNHCQTTSVAPDDGCAFIGIDPAGSRDQSLNNTAAADLNGSDSMLLETNLMSASPAAATATERNAAHLAWQRIADSMKPPNCRGHNEPSVIRTVKKKGPNNGRNFYVCARPNGPSPVGRCNFFQWANKRTLKSSEGLVGRVPKRMKS